MYSDCDGYLMEIPPPSPPVSELGLQHLANDATLPDTDGYHEDADMDDKGREQKEAEHDKKDFGCTFLQHGGCSGGVTQEYVYHEHGLVVYSNPPMD